MEGKNGQTERATAKKRQEERKQGNLAVSQEVMTVLVLLTATFLMRHGFPHYLAGTKRMLEFVLLTAIGGETWTGTWVQEIYFKGMFSVLLVLTPLLSCVMLAGVVGSIAQTGPYFSWGAFKAGGLKALNPIKGAKKLFSIKSVTKLLMTLLKIGVIAGLIWIVMARHWDTIAQLPAFDLTAVCIWAGHRIFYTLLSVAILAILIAVIDTIITRRQHEKAMMMSKHEVKDERKQYEMKPEVKRAQFRKMRDLTMSRLVATVPDATVVVTNPTRVAVALRYDPATMDTPQVIAKGLRLRAKRIRELARQHGVPIVERPPLARTLYKNVPVGRNIPASLFEAVAEVLAYLHRLGHRLNGWDAGAALAGATPQPSTPNAIR
jgi:flagellar biosynthesis protein FlhB